MRGQYLIKPNDDVDFLLIGDYSKRNENCCGAVATYLGPFSGIVNALAGVPQLGGQPGAVGIASGYQLPGVLELSLEPENPGYGCFR